MIHFTKHAEEKFDILSRHGVEIARDKVLQTVLQPEIIDRVARHPLTIAQSELDETHVLRVIYRQEGNIKTVITFYPGRKKKYE